MKRSFFITCCLCLVVFTLNGQTDALAQFNTERLQVNKVGMMVLTGWAVSNIGVNAFLTRNASGSNGHFYRMNIYWNIVNLALAVPGLRHSLITDPTAISMAETVAEYHQMGKILIFNAALDVAYITGGFLMKEMAKSREKKRNILDGYGRSLILQGGFLLVFDAVLFTVLQLKNKDLTRILETIQPATTGGSVGLGLTLTF